MFGNSDNTTDLMLPILLDMANLIRRAVRSGKEPREVKQPYDPQPQLLRRSFTEESELDDELFDMGDETTTPRIRRILPRNHTNKPNTGDRVQNTIQKEINNVTNTKVDVSNRDINQDTVKHCLTLEKTRTRLINYCFVFNRIRFSHDKR